MKRSSSLLVSVVFHPCSNSWHIRMRTHWITDFRVSLINVFKWLVSSNFALDILLLYDPIGKILAECDTETEVANFSILDFQSTVREMLSFFHGYSLVPSTWQIALTSSVCAQHVHGLFVDVWMSIPHICEMEKNAGLFRHFYLYDYVM